MQPAEGTALGNLAAFRAAFPGSFATQEYLPKHKVEAFDAAVWARQGLCASGPGFDIAFGSTT